MFKRRCNRLQGSHNLACDCSNYSRFIHTAILMEVTYMKVVVVKSPKCLRGILRLMFGIKKETN